MSFRVKEESSDDLQYRLERLYKELNGVEKRREEQTRRLTHRVHKGRWAERIERSLVVAGVVTVALLLVAFQVTSRGGAEGVEQFLSLISTSTAVVITLGYIVVLGISSVVRVSVEMNLFDEMIDLEYTYRKREVICHIVGEKAPERELELPLYASRGMARARDFNLARTRTLSRLYEGTGA